MMTYPESSNGLSNPRVMGCLMLSLALVGCSMFNEVVPHEEVDYTVTGTIGPEGGSLVVKDDESPIYGAGLFVPPGALDTPAELTIKPTGVVQDGITDESRFGPTVVFGPRGKRFNHPVEIQLPNRGNAADKAVLTVANDQATYLDISGDETNPGVILAITDHFSTFAVVGNRLRTTLYRDDAFIYAEFYLDLPTNKVRTLSAGGNGSTVYLSDIIEGLEIGDDLVITYTVRLMKLGDWESVGDSERFLGDVTMATHDLKVSYSLDENYDRSVTYRLDGTLLFSLNPNQYDEADLMLAKPLLMVFDAPIDEDTDYYVSVDMDGRHPGDNSVLFNVRGLNNRPEAQPIEALPLFEIVDADADGLIDAFDDVIE